MIGWLRGVVVETDKEVLILDVRGVGYEVQVPLGLLKSRGSPGEELTLWIHTHATSDNPAATLFGFLSSEQRRVFRLLLKVKGVGPRLAQGIIGHLGGRGVVDAVGAQDVKKLQTVTGVGKKTAQQVILDLSGKVDAIVSEAAGPPQGVLGEVTSALVNLGFRRGQVDRALRTLSERKQAEGTFDEIFRQALALLREA